MIIEDLSPASAASSRYLKPFILFPALSCQQHRHIKAQGFTLYTTKRLNTPTSSTISGSMWWGSCRQHCPKATMASSSPHSAALSRCNMAESWSHGSSFSQKRPPSWYRTSARWTWFRRKGIQDLFNKWNSPWTPAFSRHRRSQDLRREI